MMQSADVRDFDDRAAPRRLFRPRCRCVLVKGEVGSPLVVVDEVLMDVVAQRTLVPYDDVVEALRRREPITRSTNGFCQGA
jgi:hypothetical protein